MSQFEDRIQNILKEEVELPEVVSDKAGQAFLQIQQRKAESKQKHTGIRNVKAAVIALVIILSVGTPVAAAVKHFGLMDYFNQRENNIPQEAATMIVDNVEQEQLANEESSLVDFKIREYLYDVNQIYFVIEAKPTDEKYMLIPQWSEEGDPVEDLQIEGVSGMSIAEYAQLQGKELLHASVFVDIGGGSQSYDYRLEDDGTAVYIISGDNGIGTAQTEFTCATCVYPLHIESDEEMIRDSFTFQMEATGSQTTLSYVLTDIQAAKALGIIFDDVLITETELEIHVEFLYHYADGLSKEDIKRNDDIAFQILGDDGDELEATLNNAGWTEMLEDGSFKEVRNYEKTSLPEELTIRLRDVFEKESYGTIKMIKE